MKMLHYSMLFTALAFGMIEAKKDARKEHGCCSAYEGFLTRCYAVNTNPDYLTGGATFKIVDDKGCEIGYTEAFNRETLKQKWVTKDGCLKAEFAGGSSLFSATPIAQAVKAFPEVKPYLSTNPDAEVWVFSGDHFKKDSAVVLSWKGTGSFKDVNVVEVRCVFLVLKENGVPYLHKCLGCHWFFGKK